MARRLSATAILTLCLCAFVSVVVVLHRLSSKRWSGRGLPPHPTAAPAIDEAPLFGDGSDAAMPDASIAAVSADRSVVVDLRNIWHSGAKATHGAGAASSVAAEVPVVWGRVPLNQSAITLHGRYIPVYAPWQRQTLDFVHPVGDRDGCVGWRQTGRCRPDGPQEPFFSRGCDERVNGPSGFCLCANGVRVHAVSCDQSGARAFTCRSECAKA
jgi:hypothetical protein